MFQIIIIYLIASFISILISLYFMHKSPMGYEDETGFHKINKENKI